MIIHSTKFIGSFTREDQCPKDMKPEYAFIGRSNVGKSSLINMLTDRKDLARVSNQPGKTQHLNYYLVNEIWYLVDLPGYGYAKISKKKREEWRKMMNYYLANRQQLCNVFILVDGSIPPQKLDIEFINTLGQMSVPFSIVFTKIDKAKPPEVEAYREKFFEKLSEYWAEMPGHFNTSSTKVTGREAVLDFISEINTEYEQIAIEKSRNR